MKKLLILLTVLSGMCTAAACSREPAIDTQQVSALAVTEALPTEDPASPLWDRAAEHPARLMVQDVTEPRLTTPGVELIKVRALHNGQWVVFRLEWEDKTQDLIPDTGQGSDGVAIQFPTQPGADVPNAAMGEAGKGVQICFWKAVWQDDAARGEGTDRIAALHPNASIDHYPYLGNEAARAEMAKRYAPAVAAGNPIAVKPEGAVQELVAEGFGTTTVAPKQGATGRGVWRDGRWFVTIARPLDEGPQLARLTPGQRTYAAFAVWDGGARHFGARKMRSGWVPLMLAGN